MANTITIPSIRMSPLPMGTDNDDMSPRVDEPRLTAPAQSFLDHDSLSADRKRPVGTTYPSFLPARFAIRT